jgi:hypothetical protein
MEERRPPKVHAPSDAQSDAQSYAMQVLTTEHWSLSPLEAKALTRPSPAPGC